MIEAEIIRLMPMKQRLRPETKHNTIKRWVFILKKGIFFCFFSAFKTQCMINLQLDCIFAVNCVDKGVKISYPWVVKQPKEEACITNEPCQSP